VACFGGATLARCEGFTGAFAGSFDWRWQPSAEDQYLADRQAHQPAASDTSRQIGTVQWAEFRGPHRDNVVPGARLDEHWNASSPKELWRCKVGPGWSSFAVTTDLIYTQEQRGESEAVVCYDAKTGSEVWSYVYPSRFWEAIAGAGPRATPTLHDGAVYALGAEGILCRLDARTGQMAWTRDLRADAERKPPMWGFSSSPLVTQGRVIVHAGGTGDKGLLAYDLKTGARSWGAAAGDHSYSSPQLATVAGQPCILMLTNAGLSAYDPATGKPLWEHEWKFEGYRAVQPLLVGETGLLLGTGIGAGTRRIDVKREGGAVKTTERWTTLGMKAGFNDFVAHKGALYGFDNSIFACIDLETGEKKWKGGRYGNGQVLLLPDADQLLVISETGNLVLLRTNPDRLEELARIPVLTGKTWNHPVLAGNRLYLRNGEEAACYEMKTAPVQVQ
jgi:outer membrane protein assembly factor BamB